MRELTFREERGPGLDPRSRRREVGDGGGCGLCGASASSSVPCGFCDNPSPPHTDRTLLHPPPVEEVLLSQCGVISDHRDRVYTLRVMPGGQGHPEVFVRSDFSRGNVRRLARKTPLTLTFLGLSAILTKKTALIREGDLMPLD